MEGLTQTAALARHSHTAPLPCSRAQPSSTLSHSHTHCHSLLSSPFTLSLPLSPSHSSASTRASGGASICANAISRTGTPASATWQGATWQMAREQAAEGGVSGMARRRCLAVSAKRKGNSGATAVAEGEELDEDLRTGLNEISNEAIRVMLGEDIQQLMEFKDKVDTVGEYLVSEGLMDAARFMLVLKGMLDHQLVEEAKLLEGPYKKAFEKVGSVMEDSGWLLAPPESEAGNVEMVDDELIPPVLRNPY